MLCATPHYRGPAPVHATTSTNASTTSTQASVSEYQVPSASSSLTSGGAVAATTVAATTNSELVAESFQEADEKMETCKPIQSDFRESKKENKYLYKIATNLPCSNTKELKRIRVI